MQTKLENLIRDALTSLSVEVSDIHLEHPTELSHGDYSTNVAFVVAPKAGKKPRELAEELSEKLNEQKDEMIEKIEVAGPGFINFFLSREFFTKSIEEVLKQKENYGKNETLKGKKVMIEYTDPNPFKEFHIGHLMSNSIGESLSRILEFSGAEVKRANYQGDVGLHVSQAIWGWKKKISEGETTLELLVNLSIEDKVASLGVFYALGSQSYEKDVQGSIKKEIEEINKKIYEKSDEEIGELYELGKKWSLKYFETIYRRLGTKFDYYFFESETGIAGKELVLEHLKDGIFEKSEGALIFRGGLHTRVFINSEGLPTYEAKDLGLAHIKANTYPHDLSIIVTGNEVNDYFKVLLKALEMISPELAQKTRHVSHGMLRLPSGKMSSRTGNIVTADVLLKEVGKYLKTKMENTDVEDKKNVLDQIAVGSVKYSILKQALGHDVIFDFDKSLSFEGNSGPYLQYTYARARSVLRKAQDRGLTQTKRGLTQNKNVLNITEVERLLYRFPEVVERAQQEYAPHHITTFLFELAQAFNNFYAKERIVDPPSPPTSSKTSEGHSKAMAGHSAGEYTSYRVALTEATATIIKNGLRLLGIKAPERM